MLPSLRIKNFRAFPDLLVPKLGRVNLIVGSNGVGKTTLLEAVRVYAAGADAPREVAHILEQREEIPADPPDDGVDLAHFHRRSGFTPADSVRIGPAEGGPTLELEFRGATRVGTHDFTRRLLEGLDAQASVENFGEVLGRALSHARGAQARWIDAEGAPQRSYHYLQAHGMPPSLIGKLWDRLVLEGREQAVLKICQVLLPSLAALSLVQLAEDEARVVVARLGDSRQARPLRSLGEGAQRAFELALGLACAQSGFLLLDEFENGLHYSIHEALWGFIFEAATQQDIQVFATTHSLDCIRAFQRAAAGHPEHGMLIRLYRSREDGQIRATLFDEEDLEAVAESAIEVRG